MDRFMKNWKLYSADRAQIEKLIPVEMAEEMTVRSMEEFGMPTHCFTVGANLYALVCEEDVRLFVNAKMQQQLVCTAPKRNFVVKAENLEFRV